MSHWLCAVGTCWAVSSTSLTGRNMRGTCGGQGSAYMWHLKVLSAELVCRVAAEPWLPGLTVRPPGRSTSVQSRKDGSKNSRLLRLQRLCPGNHRRACVAGVPSSHTPVHLEPVYVEVTVAVSGQRLHTGCQSPSSRGPAHLIQFC